MSRDFLGYSEHDGARVSRQRSFAIEVHPNLFFFLEIFKAQKFGMELFWVLIFGPIRSSLSLEIRSTPPPWEKSSSLLPIVTSSVVMVK